MPDSLEQLSKSQLFDRRGQIVDETVKIAGASVQQQAALSNLENTIVDQKYKIISLLGSGGMGAVYRAHHISLNKDVALKTFKSPNLTDDTWQRFQREAKAISKLAHKNIVQVFDFGFSENNVPYYTMECLDGQSLDEKLASGGPLPLVQAIKIFLQICDGLALAHSKGIIHRDLKPGNIFLAQSGGTDGIANAQDSATIVKVVDFGLAGLASNPLEQQKLTTTGTIFGSPLYMSPEQSLGLEVTERSDIYSLGCTLFETLTGAPPFRGDNAFATMVKHQQANIPRLTDVAPDQQFPQRVQGLLAKMLAKNPDRRFQSLTELTIELKHILDSSLSSYESGYNHSPVNEPLLENSDPSFLAEGRINNGESESSFFSSKVFIITICAIFICGIGFFTVSLLKKKTTAANNEIFSSPEAVAVPRYLQNPDAPAGHEHIFEFPTDTSLGLIQLLDGKGGGVGARIKARGRVIVPAYQFLELHADLSVSLKPELLRGFAPNDLVSLILPQDYDWHDNVINEIVKLKSLKGLNVQDAEITAEALTRLNALKELRMLKIGKNKLTQDQIANLAILPQINNFSVEDISPVTKILEVYRNSNTLSELYVVSCSLQNSDMKIIGTMHNLRTLEISENQQVSDDGLKEISKLPKLNWLGVVQTGVKGSSIKTLQDFPALKHLKIELDPADDATLRKALPACDISAGKDSNTDRDIAPLDDSNSRPYRRPSSGSKGSPQSFSFPEHKSIGTLLWYSPKSRIKSLTPREAEGAVTMPFDAQITFNANAETAKHPALFDGFRPDDLFSLLLVRDSGWGDEQMDHVCKLTGLRVLNIGESDISDKSIANLNRLNQIVGLAAEKTQLSGPGLAHISWLNKLKDLDISHMQSFPECLQKLATSSSLRELKATSCGLQDKDFGTIGTLTNLKKLNVAENPKVTNQSLSSLVHLKKLENLTVNSTAINAGAIAYIKQMPHLKTITLDLNDWSKADRARLSAAHKGLTIHQSKETFDTRKKDPDAFNFVTQ